MTGDLFAEEPCCVYQPASAIQMESRRIKEQNQNQKT